MLDAVGCVMKKLGLSYTEAVDRIRADRHLFGEQKIKVKKQKNRIDTVDGDLEESAFYWKRFHIPLTIVKKYTSLARSVYVNETFSSRSTKNNPIFAYRFISGNIKLYRPLSPEKDKKWGGNSEAIDVGGWMQLPRKGKLCIVTSSIKDVMVFVQHGFPAICFNGESYGAEKSSDSGKVVGETIALLRKRFKHVLLFLDNDESGLKGSLKLQKNFNIAYTNLKGSEKDISDYQKKYGVHKTHRIIKRLIAQKHKSDEIPY